MKTLTTAFILILLFASLSFAEEIKNPDLAGSWYPASAEELSDLLGGYLKAAVPEKIEGDLFAVIVPHAGYRFSGPIAAYGFKALENRNIKTVILIGFSHRKPFDGISVYDRGAFVTPLGRMTVDSDIAKGIISRSGRIRFYPEAFEDENSVEMEIPFIQMILKDAKIVPIAFGTQSFEDANILAEALANELKGRRDYVLLASTDLSHYHPYADARSIDSHMMRVLTGMKAKDLYDEAGIGLCELCGIMPVTSVLLAAEKMGFNKLEILKYANSGDTSGNRDSVVGYLSAALYKEYTKDEGGGMKDNNMLNDSQRKKLLQIARESIVSYVKTGKRKSFNEKDPVLNQPMGAFVTLHEDGELRGCIGNIMGHGPLYETISDIAVEAATGDPRFNRLSPQEIDRIDIEISVLSPLKKVYNLDEIKIPGHGVLVRMGMKSGVYLPQVATETGWSKEEFMSSLCAHKAGIGSDAWKDPAAELYIFTAEIFGEKGASK